jgi:hypothetical protein
MPAVAASRRRCAGPLPDGWQHLADGGKTMARRLGLRSYAACRGIGTSPILRTCRRAAIMPTSLVRQRVLERT